MLKFYLDVFGAYGVIVALLSRLSKYTNRPKTVSVPTFVNKRFSVRIRLKTSDLFVYQDIFAKKELDLDVPQAPRVIIDAGAYTGLSSVYFAARYPEARIIAIEPDKSNFTLLASNARAFPNIVPVEAALWKEETELSLHDPGRSHWGFQTFDSASGIDAAQRVPSVTIESIMRDHSIDFIDILKLDIEGSEIEVLDSSSRWIDKVGILIAELHDRFREGCEESFEAATSNFEYKKNKGEKVIRMKKRFAPKK